MRAEISTQLFWGFLRLIVASPLVCSSVSIDCLSTEPDVAKVHLLQTKVYKSRKHLTGSPPHISTNLSFHTYGTTRLQKSKPLVWLGIPKTGSNWKFVFEEMRMMYAECEHEPGSLQDICPSSLNVLLGACHTTAMGDPVSYARDYLGHTVALFRQPEQRLISGFNGGHHSWGCSRRPESVLEYAVALQGCSVKMLTRVSGDLLGPVLPRPCTILAAEPSWACGLSPKEEVCSNQSPPTDEETSLAVARVKDFVFVGITEEWDLSVCLFHVMFGGKCLRTDFIAPPNSVTDNHQSIPLPSQIEKDNETGLYLTEALHGFTDKPDRYVYTEALRVFRERLEEYNVSRASCRPCFEDAGV